MKVFTCNDFEGRWPVGTAAVIVAPNETCARAILDARLSEYVWYKGTSYTLNEVNLDLWGATILTDGDY